MMAQKFHRGDVVRVVADAPSDRDALIIGSYADLYGGTCTDLFSLLFVDDGSRVSWFSAGQLTFVRHVGESAIAEVEQRRRDADTLHSSLDWIITNWNPKNMPGRSIQALADACGFGSLWGASGEGFTWYRNANMFIDIFNAVMRTGNRQLVEQKIESVKAWFKGSLTPGEKCR